MKREGWLYWFSLVIIILIYITSLVFGSLNWYTGATLGFPTYTLPLIFTSWQRLWLPVLSPPDCQYTITAGLSLRVIRHLHTLYTRGDPPAIIFSLNIVGGCTHSRLTPLACNATTVSDENRIHSLAPPLGSHSRRKLIEHVGDTSGWCREGGSKRRRQFLWKEKTIWISSRSLTCFLKANEQLLVLEQCTWLRNSQWTVTNSSIFGSETSLKTDPTSLWFTHCRGIGFALGCYISQSKILSFLACLFIVVATGGSPVMSLLPLLNSGWNSSTVPDARSLLRLCLQMAAALPSC